MLAICCGVTNWRFAQTVASGTSRWPSIEPTAGVETEDPLVPHSMRGEESLQLRGKRVHVLGCAQRILEGVTGAFLRRIFAQTNRLSARLTFPR